LDAVMDEVDFFVGWGGGAWISERDHSRRSRYDLALESDQGLMVVLAELQGLKKGPSEASTGGAASAPEAGETEGHEAGG